MMMGIGMPINHSSAPLPRPIVASYVRAETTPTLLLKFRKRHLYKMPTQRNGMKIKALFCEAREAVSYVRE
jgi:hypothetical protein